MTQNVNNVLELLTNGKIGGAATGGIGVVGDDVGTNDGIDDGETVLEGLEVRAMVGAADGTICGATDVVVFEDVAVGNVSLSPPVVGDVVVELTAVKSNPLRSFPLPSPLSLSPLSSEDKVDEELFSVDDDDDDSPAKGTVTPTSKQNASKVAHAINPLLLRLSISKKDALFGVPDLKRHQLKVNHLAVVSSFSALTTASHEAASS
jgi:hypothetical protein